MTGHQIYRRFMAGEALFEIFFRAEVLLRKYLSRRDARRAKRK